MVVAALRNRPRGVPGGATAPKALEWALRFAARPDEGPAYQKTWRRRQRAWKSSSRLLHSNTTGSPRRARSRSSRPKGSSTSATWRSPTHPALPTPARRSRPIPREAANLTSRANLVGVITNGTAVLGLGNIGPLAGKPVMEGKGCLFKKFAGIDVFDIELNEHDPEKLVDIIAALEPTLGGINLEDIKAPECFYVEQKLRERLTDPRVPRRPAWNRNHRRRGRDQRPEGGRQADRQGQAGLLRRRRFRHRLSRSAGAAGLEPRKRLRVRQQGRDLPGPRAEHGAEQGPLRAQDRSAHARRRDAGCGHFPGTVERGCAQAGSDQEDGGQAAHPGAG